MDAAAFRNRAKSLMKKNKIIQIEIAGTFGININTLNLKF
jgi:hypothetical protein